MFKTAIRKIIQRYGYDLVPRERKRANVLPVDFTTLHREITEKTKPYTLTSPKRIFALVEAVRYLVANGIEGAFVECGVYKGGSMMAAAMTLLSESINDRDLYLYDTFEGMPKPGSSDVDAWGKAAAETFEKEKLSDSSSRWANSPIEEVKEAMSSTGYPADRVHYIKGLVEDTLPETAPDRIALLRLDTDWYQSTRHELVHLYPRVVRKGVVIVDDYGHFQGARQAVDEFFAGRDLAPYLHRIDYTGRLLVKHEIDPPPTAAD